MGTPEGTNATMEQQQRNGLFYAVRAKMLQAGHLEFSNFNPSIDTPSRDNTTQLLIM
jgi:hypothetical protein